MPCAAAVVVTGFSGTTPFATWSAPLSASSLLSPLSWRKLASCFLPNPLNPGGPDSGSIHPPGGGRRPAVIWVPRGSSGLAEAWDFFISSLLLLGLSFRSWGFSRGRVPQELLPEYCLPGCRPGCTLRPLVLEACGGGWSPALREVIARVSTESLALRGSVGDTPRDVSLRIAQRISCTLQRENARAVLRRAPQVVDGFSGLAGDQVSGKCPVFSLGFVCCSFGCHLSFLLFLCRLLALPLLPSPLSLFPGRVCLSFCRLCRLSVLLWLLCCARCLCLGFGASLFLSRRIAEFVVPPTDVGLMFLRHCFIWCGSAAFLTRG